MRTLFNVCDFFCKELGGKHIPPFVRKRLELPAAKYPVYRAYQSKDEIGIDIDTVDTLGKLYVQLDFIRGGAILK